MTNANDPIFQTVYRQTGADSYRPATEKEIKEGIYLVHKEGLTKREYFAANCPPVPDWFKHTSPKKGFGYPKWEEIATEEHRNEAKEWAQYGIGDLPDYLAWFQKMWDEANKKERDWAFNNTEARFFQWRTYYADKMIEALNK